jgi:hypothetical protein
MVMIILGGSPDMVMVNREIKLECRDKIDKTNPTLNEYRVQFDLHKALPRLDPGFNIDISVCLVDS